MNLFQFLDTNQAMTDVDSDIVKDCHHDYEISA